MNSNGQKIVFLDRDGVINKEIGYLYKVEDFKFIDGVFEACRYLQTIGYKLIIVTNQAGIAKGYYKKKDFHILTKWMLAQFNSQGISVLKVFFCPHSSESNCKCRKPQPGMLVEACNEFNIDMERSWLIGDKEIDISAAISAGINNTILVKSGHVVDEINSKAKFILESVKDSVQLFNRCIYNEFILNH